MDAVTALENAILERADRLAAEYREHAERSRARILQEAHERLHLREEREVLLAKAQAERDYRRRVQSSELKLREEMDHLRWKLVGEVEQRLAVRMSELAADESAYLPVLGGLLSRAAAEIERRELVAVLNARDLERLQPRWEAFARAAAPDKTVRLWDAPMESRGGILLRSPDNRIRLDNSFEGRMERLRNRLEQVIVSYLLPEGAAPDTMGLPL